MILEGSFYNIRKTEELGNGEYNVVVDIAKEHPIYEGHFPQQAVVPGVCTLTIIKECLGKILARNVVFDAIKDCKYISALLPQDDLSITITFSLAELPKIRAVVVRNDNGAGVLKLRATIR